MVCLGEGPVHKANSIMIMVRLLWRNLSGLHRYLTFDLEHKLCSEYSPYLIYGQTTWFDEVVLEKFDLPSQSPDLNSKIFRVAWNTSSETGLLNLTYMLLWRDDLVWWGCCDWTWVTFLETWPHPYLIPFDTHWNADCEPSLLIQHQYLTSDMFFGQITWFDEVVMKELEWHSHSHILDLHEDLWAGLEYQLWDRSSHPTPDLANIPLAKWHGLMRLLWRNNEDLWKDLGHQMWGRTSHLTSLPHVPLARSAQIATDALMDLSKAPFQKTEAFYSRSGRQNPYWH